MRQLRTLLGVEDHGVGLLGRKMLGKVGHRRVDAGQLVGNLGRVELLSQHAGEFSHARRRVVAIDEDRTVAVLIALQEAADRHRVEQRVGLIDLEDLGIALHLPALDGEGNDERYLVATAEVGQRLHLRGVERAKDDVEGSGVGVEERRADIGVLGYVPGVDVSVDAFGLHLIEGEEQTTVVFHHPAAIAIVVVQRQHHAHADRAILLLRGGSRWTLGRDRSLCSLWSSLRGSRAAALVSFLTKGDDYPRTFLQLIALLFHFRIGVYDLLNRHIIFFGDAEKGFSPLHLVQVLPLWGLTARMKAKQRGEDRDPHPQAMSHFSNFILTTCKDSKK